MENNVKKANQEPEIALSQKEKILEFVASTLCFLLLLACFVKVVFL